jgi:hypothetical protein
LAQIDRLRVQRLAPAEGQQPVGEVAAATQQSIAALMASALIT